MSLQPLRAPYSLIAAAAGQSTAAAALGVKSIQAPLEDLAERGLDFDRAVPSEKAWHLNGRLIKLKSSPQSAGVTQLTLCVDQIVCAQNNDDIQQLSQRAMEMLDLHDLG